MGATLGALLLLLVLASLADRTAAFGKDDLFERYSKMKLLTSCMGQETLNRWRQQMVAAAKTCEEERPFIPALLHQLPTVVRQPDRNTYFVPTTQFNPLYQPHYHQQLSQPKPQGPIRRPQVTTSHFVQRIPQKVPATYYVTSPFVHQKYYYLTQPQQTSYQPTQYVSYPQVASYSQNKPTVVTYHPQSHFQNGHQQQSQATFQGYQNNQRFTDGIQQSQPGKTSSASSSGGFSPQKPEGITFNQKLFPGIVAPNVQYIAAQQQYQQQQENYEQQQKHPWVQKTNLEINAAANSERQPARQEQTYTDPSLKYEDTEHYQEQQKRLAAHKERRGTGNAPLTSSFHQKRPSLQDQEFGAAMGANKRGRRSAQQQASSARYPHYHQAASPDSLKAQQLRQMQTRVNDQLNNMTCVMRAMMLLTEELEPNFSFLENSLLELPISNEMYEELKEGQEYCKLSAMCQPRRRHLHDIAISPGFSSSLEFFRCFGKEKLRACLKADVATMSRLLGTERGGPLTEGNAAGAGSGGFSGGSPIQPALEDLENLLNGGSGQFVDLVLL